MTIRRAGGAVRRRARRLPAAARRRLPFGDRFRHALEDPKAPLCSGMKADSNTCQRIERLVVVGTSAGGYAALVFGSLLGADRVLCWGPQTTLDLDALGQMDDHRWDDKIAALTANRHLEEDWMDLRRALPGARRAQTRYELFFDGSYLPDRLHVDRLREVDGVELRPVAGGEHEVARLMRKTGELEEVLRSALGV